MRSAQQTVTTTAAVIGHGENGSTNRPVRCTVRPASGTVYLGGPGVTSSNGFPVASTDAPVTVTLISEQLWCVSGSSIVVNVLESGA